MKKKILSLILAGVLSAGLCVPAAAATTAEEIENAKAQKATAESNLEQTRDKINSLENKKQELEDYLNQLNAQYDELTSGVEELTFQAAEKEEELKEIEKELEAARKDEEEQYEAMKLRISYMYENGGASMLESLLSAENLADFLNRAENFEQITEYDRKMLEKYEETQKTISSHEEKVEQEVEEINALREESSQKRQQVRDLAASTNNDIVSYAQQISSSEAEAATLLDEVVKTDNSLTSLMMKQAQEEEQAAKAALEQEQAQAQAQSQNEEKQETQTSETEGTQEDPQEPQYDPESDTQASESSSTSYDIVVEEVEEESAPQESETQESSTEVSSGQGTYLGTFTLTAYCNCAKCCGTAGNLTASGTWPVAGRTVAMGGVPFGTQLMINGNVYTVEDLGTPYGHVDIFFNSHEEALAFGRQSAEVYQLN